MLTVAILLIHTAWGADITVTECGILGIEDLMVSKANGKNLKINVEKPKNWDSQKAQTQGWKFGKFSFQDTDLETGDGPTANFAPDNIAVQVMEVKFGLSEGNQVNIILKLKDDEDENNMVIINCEFVEYSEFERRSLNRMVLI